MSRTLKVQSRVCRSLLVLATGAALASLFVFLRAGDDRGVSAQDLNKLNRFVQSSNASDSAMRVFRDGRDRIADEDRSRAAGRFRDFINEYPKHKDVDAAHYWLAFALKKQGKYREADQQVERLMRDYPRSNWIDDARAMRVEIAGETGDRAAIQAELDKSNQELKMIALQSLFQADPERAAALAGEILKPDSKANRQLFDVRPGVAVDADFKGHHGVTNVVGGTSVSVGSQIETRNLGVFLLHEADGNAIARVEVYNLDRQREYSGYRVYWLGRGGNEESLSLLQSLAASNQPEKVAEHAVFAIAVHDDPRVGGLLKGFVRQSSVTKVRSNAVFWLGQVGGETAFLSELIRNPSENVEVRKQAAFAIGVSKDQAALTTLQNLYGSVAEREVKKQIIFAVSINENSDAAVNFLIDTARNDSDREARKQAIFWLGQKAGKRSLDALGDTIDSNDADTEVQKQAVFALSQRPKDEAVPLLIKIAKTHAKPAVRKQAIFWLGQTGDERAVDFFKEVLLK
jgi:HEAT repeat protein